MLTDTQVEYYYDNGYLVVKKVLNAEEVAELRSVTDEFVEKSAGVTSNDDVFDLEPSHSPENPRLRRLKNPADQHPVYDKTLRHDKILDIVAQLIGSSIRCNGQKLNMKLPQGGSPVEWHQDWAFHPHTNDDLLAVGVALDDANQENGCLLVLPGTHKGRILDHHQDGHFVGAVTEPEFVSGGAVPVVLEAGDISIHHVRVLHASMPNTSDKPRRLLLLMYCAVDAWPLMIHAKWDDFIKTFNGSILRGMPNYRPRLSEVPIRIPLPPALRQGSIYQSQLELKRSTLAT